MIYYSTANLYYSSSGHHEQENQKATSKIKFLALTIKQRIKQVLLFHSRLATYAILLSRHFTETARQDYMGFDNIAWLGMAG